MAHEFEFNTLVLQCTDCGEEWPVDVESYSANDTECHNCGGFSHEVIEELLVNEHDYEVSNHKVIGLGD